LKADGNLQRTFIEGLTNGAPADISSDFNETIENGIKNRLDFAARQLTRAIVCEPYIVDPAEKELVALEAFAEFIDSLVLAEKWNTPDIQEM
jgi:hypothetical protein